MTLEVLAEPSAFGIARTSLSNALSKSPSTSQATPSSRQAELLDPLSRALLYELTTRRETLEKAKLEVAFWTSPQGQQLERKYFSPAAGDKGRGSVAHGKARARESGENATEAQEQELDEKVAALKEQYEAALDREGVKKALLAAADEQHAIVSNFAKTSFKEQKLSTPAETADKPLRTRQQAGPSGRLAQLAALRGNGSAANLTAKDIIEGTITTAEDATSTSKDDMRSLIGRRDELSLQLLHRHKELSQLQEQIKATHKLTVGHRVEMSLMLQRLRVMSSDLREQRWKLENAVAGGDTSAMDASLGMISGATTKVGRSRIGKLKDALKEVADKTEMVKGVLRGLILEGGLDWARDAELSRLILMAGDEIIDSDEDVGFSDEEEVEEEAVVKKGQASN